jgi:polyferredoxin
VIRDRNNLYVETVDGGVENIYRLHIVNMDPRPHDYRLSIDGIEGAELLGDARYQLDGGEDLDVTLRVRARPEALSTPNAELVFEIVAEDMPSLRAVHESRFMKPL